MSNLTLRNISVGVITFENILAIFYKVQHGLDVGNLVVPFLSVYPREIKTDVYTKTYT